MTRPRTPASVDSSDLSRGIELHRLGRNADAARVYRQVLQRKPDNAEALYLLGIVELAGNKFRRAVDLIGRSIKRNATFAPAHANRGVALMALGHHEEALASFDRAIALGFNEAHFNKAILLTNMRRLTEALDSCDAAISGQPGLPEAHNQRGHILNESGCHEAALPSLDRAISLQPNLAEAHHNRGTALLRLNRPAEALVSFDRALALRPDLTDTWCNRGDALADLKQPEAALASFDRAIALRADFAEAYFGRALTRLLIGRYEEGLRDYEWRTRRSGQASPRSLPRPVWLGDRDIKGKTLFIHPELFLGDMIQFCRYAPLAARLGARIVLAVQDPLMPLLIGLGPDITLLSEAAVPDRYDLHCPMMSLPLAFDTTLRTIPGEQPYLHADPDRVAAWRQRIGTHGFRIGICWQGSASSVNMGRSFPVARFAEIARMSGVRLISLQVGAGSDQLTALPEGMVVEDFTGQTNETPRPFTETAAMMENLDLIITPDTAIAHLAGAIGRPTWVALKLVPDWRWGLEGASTAWYPTWRLFRQTTRNDWAPVFHAMQQALVALLPSATSTAPLIG
jgi:tetratricopeptide (TPR) repeat protein